MKYVPVVLASALALYVAATPVKAADETKSVKGTVTAVAGDTVTLQVADKTMNFKVDKATDVIARGGGTATRAAQAAGQPGPKLADIVKVGEGAEVHYKEAAGVMQATMIRAGIEVSDKVQAKEESEKNAHGKVTAVTGTGFTVNSGGKDMKFVYDAKKSRLEGTGMSTKTRELEKLGKTPTLGDFIAVNDEVSVDYKEEAGAMHATVVRMIKKAR